MIHSNFEPVDLDSGRSRTSDSVESRPTLRQTSRFRADDEEDATTGGLRYAAGIWRNVAAKRRQLRKP
jgi:hypothetical protein